MTVFLRAAAALATMILPAQALLAQTKQPTRSAQTILVENVDIIPMDSERLLENHDILIRGGRILAVAPHGDIADAGDTERVDGEGLSVLPGLWESHAHVTATDFEAAQFQDETVLTAINAQIERRMQGMLASGITSVRDLGMPEELLPMARALRDREDLPDLRFSGPIVNGQKNRWSRPLEVHVVSESDAHDVVDRLAAAGVNFIKTYDNVTEEAFREIAARARSHGLSVAGHIPHNVTTRAAIDSGMQSVQHTYVDYVKDCTELGNSAPVAPLGAWMEGGYGARWAKTSEIYRSRDVEACKALYARIGERGVFAVATPQMDLPFDRIAGPAELAALEPAARAACETGIADHKRVDTTIRGAIAADLSELYGDLRAAGVRFVAGSDAPNDCMGFGRTLIRSIELYQELGFSKFEALQTATIHAAQMAGARDEGVIAPGAIANLAFYDANPLADLSALYTPRAVMLHGEWVSTQHSAEPEHDLAITNTNVINVADGTILPNATVTIDGGRISSVHSTGDEAAKARTVIDGTGQYVFPGLIDMHVHTDASGLALYLDHGVTTVRDMGTHFAPLEPDSGGQLRLREEIRSGTRNGPELVLALRILDGDIERNSQWAMHFASVATPQEGRDLVDKVAASGGDLVKVYTDLNPDVFAAIVDQARAQGLPIVGHVPGRVGYAEAARAGLLTAEHLRGIFIDLSSQEDRWHAAFTTEAAKLDAYATYKLTSASLVEMAQTFDPAKEAALFELLKDEGVGMVPTLSVLGDPRWEDPEAEIDAELVARLSPIYQSIVTPTPDIKGPFDSIEQARTAYQLQADLVGRMHRAGIAILVGTDSANGFTVPGFSLHQELELLVEAGLSPADALRAATLVNARYLGSQDRLGQVQEGMEADLVMVSANPLIDITATRTIEAVIVDGKLHAFGQ